MDYFGIKTQQRENEAPYIDQGKPRAEAGEARCSESPGT